MLAPTDKQTKATPIVIDGTVWNCWHTGILRYQWRASERLTAGSRGGSATFYASVDGEYLPTRFRSLKAAMKAAQTKLKD